MAQQLFFLFLFLNNNIIITSNKIMWGITPPLQLTFRIGVLKIAILLFNNTNNNALNSSIEDESPFNFK